MINSISHLKLLVRLNGWIAPFNFKYIEEEFLLDRLDTVAREEGFDDFEHVCETCCGDSLMKFLDKYDTNEILYAPLRNMDEVSLHA